MKNVLLVVIMMHLLIYSLTAKSNEVETKPVTYYISANGSDKNDGSIDKPFASLEHAIRAIGAMVKKNGGQVALFR